MAAVDGRRLDDQGAGIPLETDGMRDKLRQRLGGRTTRRSHQSVAPGWLIFAQTARIRTVSTNRDYAE